MESPRKNREIIATTQLADQPLKMGTRWGDWEVIIFILHAERPYTECFRILQRLQSLPSWPPWRLQYQQ